MVDLVIKVLMRLFNVICSDGGRGMTITIEPRYTLSSRFSNLIKVLLLLFNVICSDSGRGMTTTIGPRYTVLYTHCLFSTSFLDVICSDGGRGMTMTLEPRFRHTVIHNLLFIISTIYYSYSLK